MRCGAIPVLVGALLATVAACSGSSETYALEPTAACLGARGVEVAMFEEPPEANESSGGPFRATQGSLFADGVVPVRVLFGKDGAEAEAMAERLEDNEYVTLEGRKYELEVRRRGNAALGAEVPVEEEVYDPPADEVDEALDAAEDCLRAEAPGDA